MQFLSLFPGQGSQKVGMGADFAAHELARELFACADRALGFPLSKVCFEGPIEKLTDTEVAQPAILTVSTVCFSLFRAHPAFSTHTVVAAAGHSLGEYSALVAGGAISFEDAVLLVHKRGRYMQEAVPVGVGKMAAILGKEVDEIEASIKLVKSGLVQIANVNAPGQVVVAGEKQGVEELLTIMAGVRAMELSVSAPFHCALMKPAEESLTRDLQALTISRPSFPIYANYSAQAVMEPHDIRQHLQKQVCGKVRWVECMQHAISHCHPDQALEFGFGKVLAGLLKRTVPSLRCVNIDSERAVTEYFG